MTGSVSPGIGGSRRPARRSSSVGGVSGGWNGQWTAFYATSRKNGRSPWRSNALAHEPTGLRRPNIGGAIAGEVSVAHVVHHDENAVRLRSCMLCRALGKCRGVVRGGGNHENRKGHDSGLCSVCHGDNGCRGGRPTPAFARHTSNTDAKKRGTSSVKSVAAPAGCHTTVSMSSSGRSSLGPQRSTSRASRSTIQ
jgi:hypothetical protein